MRRFWIEFVPELGRRHPPDRVGVTAWSAEDALLVVADTFDCPIPPIEVVIEDVDVSTLDLPPYNVGLTVAPGVWSPPLNLWYMNP